MKLNRQLFLLQAHEAVRGFRIAGAVWVLLLVGRGFSLAAVGVAEGVFHLVSMLFEVPSGMLADILGRRRTLIAAGLANAAAGVAMAASRGLFGVCAAMALEALSFNLASGTLEALTYDTLAENGQEARYIRQTSRQYTLYSAAQSAASLMSVFTIRLGFAAAYLLSACAGAWVRRPGRPFERVRPQRAGAARGAPAADAALPCPACAGKYAVSDTQAQAGRQNAVHQLCRGRRISYPDVLAAGPCGRGPARRPCRHAAFSSDAGRCAGRAFGSQAARTPRQPVPVVRAGRCHLYDAGGQRLPSPVPRGRGGGRFSGKRLHPAGRQPAAALLSQRQPRYADQRGQHDVQYFHGRALASCGRRCE